jgi:hypothetical protein
MPIGPSRGRVVSSMRRGAARAARFDDCLLDAGHTVGGRAGCFYPPLGSRPRSSGRPPCGHVGRPDPRFALSGLIPLGAPRAAAAPRAVRFRGPRPARLLALSPRRTIRLRCGVDLARSAYHAHEAPVGRLGGLGAAPALGQPLGCHARECRLGTGLLWYAPAGQGFRRRMSAATHARRISARSSSPRDTVRFRHPFALIWWLHRIRAKRSQPERNESHGRVDLLLLPGSR